MADGRGHGGVRLIKLYARACAFVVALFAVYVFSTPLHVAAQSLPAQQVEIHDLARRAESNDVRVQAITALVRANTSAIAELQGEERVFFAVLTVLTGGSFLGQVVGSVVKVKEERKREDG